jgi:hypothetical protein
MKVLMLMVTLVACYFPAVAGARGRGQKSMDFVCFVGLFIALGTLMLGKALNVPILILSTDAGSAGLILIEIIIRMAIGFAFGSFLAVLLFKKSLLSKTSRYNFGDRRRNLEIIRGMRTCYPEEFRGYGACHRN